MLKDKNSNIYVMPGWGFSSGIFEHSELAKLLYTPLDYIYAPRMTLRDITSYVMEKIADNSILIAWSLGGLFAIYSAYLFPHKVKKIILLASQPKFLGVGQWHGIPQAQADYFTKNARANFDVLLKKFIALVNYPQRALKNNTILKKSLISADHQEKLCQLLSLLFSTDLRPEYKALQAPIFHIVNGADAIVKQNINCLAALHENVKTIVIDNAGHAGFLTHGVQYMQAIEKFIDDE